MKKILLWLLLFTSIVSGHSVDFVIFSFDRPLQLYALLESTKKYITNLGAIHVIYRVSNLDFMNGYQEVIQAFPTVFFHKQGNNPSEDFKVLTIKAAFASPSDYIMFGVDDIIVKDYVDLQECIRLLEEENAYGFFLRLGTHLTVSYPATIPQNLPPFIKNNEQFVVWKFNNGTHNWGYPNTVDMTIYRKRDLTELFLQMNYSNPNTLESLWAMTKMDINNYGICFHNSKIINVPLNRVQNVFQNAHMNFLSVRQLLDMFLNGKKMDISTLHQIKNAGCHMDYEPTFIVR